MGDPTNNLNDEEESILKITVFICL
jgi:hypothetical protein